MLTAQIPQSAISRFLFSDTRVAVLWLALRLYVGYEWFMAGWEKLGSAVWTGPQAGVAVAGFLNGALKQTTGAHPNVSAWYGYFIENFALQHTVLFSYLVVYGELAVGIGLILGILTGIAAFFGAFMNFNYLFAGTVSTNPFLLLIEIFLILAWRNAGWWGADRWLLPKLGVLWQTGALFRGARAIKV